MMSSSKIDMLVSGAEVSNIADAVNGRDVPVQCSIYDPTYPPFTVPKVEPFEVEPLIRQHFPVTVSKSVDDHLKDAEESLKAAAKMLRADKGRKDRLLRLKKMLEELSE